MELPVFKRCCFCLPLRYGLITWGFLRLAYSVFFFITMFLSACRMWERVTTEEEPNQNIVYLAVLGGVLILIVIDLILNTIFIVGGHKKNLKLLRAYYIYSIIICILTTLLGAFTNVYSYIMYGFGEDGLSFHIWIIMVDTALFLGNTLAQIYVVLLVRSEIIKLTNNCEFRFVNNAAEAECTMKREELNGGQESEYKYERYMPEFYLGNK